MDSNQLGGLTGSARANLVRAEVLSLLPTAAPNYQDSLAAGKFYCVIEKHHLSFDPAVPDAENFLWMCAKRTISIRKIFQHYRLQCPAGDEFFHLTVAGDDQTELRADSDVKFKDLPDPEGGVLLLTATRRQKEASELLDSSVDAPPSGQGRPSRMSLQGNIQSPGARVPLSEIRQQPSTPSKSTLPKRSHSSSVKREPHQSPSLEQSPRTTIRATPSGAAPGVELPPWQSRDTNVIAAPAVPAASAAPLVEEPQYQPREQENPFVNDEAEHEAELPNRGLPLQKLSIEENPERLEAAVQAGLRVLSSLETPLKDMPANEDTLAWLDQIRSVRETAVKTRTVVGVVGNTGAGKSSVINAMLDEERLVPTNCMRACTAVVTELSYNYSENPAAKYRAEIEFIGEDDWRTELKLLFREILDDSGHVSKEVGSADSEAAVAYAKVRSVYNKLTKDGLSRTSVESLMGHTRVKNLLGKTKTFSTSDTHRFYNMLQNYVDSKEKGTEKLDKNGNPVTNQPRPFECWPLIKVVKIYTKSPALSTGAVIVDLPGVHDSNAARAAVAQGYMKQCTGLWIVAPINRAVDDKAAKTLLGDTFKRQLKFDGTYSAVTFICSKTDDISLTEATDSLKLGDRMAELDDKTSDITLRKRELSSELKEARNKIKDIESSMESIDEDEERWEDLETKISQGRTVYAPSVKRTANNRKRKSTSSESSLQAKKRRRRTIDSEDDDVDDEESEQEQIEVEADAEAANPAQSPLTQDDIETKLNELKTIRKEARREKKALEARIADLRKPLRDLDDEEDAIETRKTALAIAGRNDYSRTAIAQDFAAGIRELDQEAQEDDDPDNFNPDEDLRDYAEVARSLPVFCVSSRAYQKLSGRMKKDSDVPGYSMLAETEIPQLQLHCKKLTEKGRQASCRRFLNSMKQLLGSLGLWASDDGTGLKLTETQKDAEKSFLSRKLKELEKALEKVATDTMDDAATTLDEQLFAKFEPAVAAAVKEAVPRSQVWGAPKSDGGLLWSTYKATTRRNGVWAGSAGPRDFNADLTEPLYKTLGGVWEKAFQRRMPNILQSLKKLATNVLKQFHVAVEDRSRKSGHGLARIGMLGTNLATHSAAFADICQEAVTKLNEGQRDLSRQFNPVIAAAMEPAYDACSQESGKGSFARMKNLMHSHVGGQSQVMFEEAAEQVQASLKALCKTITKFYLEKVDDVFIAMRRDYLGVVGGAGGQITMPKEERMVRRAVDEAISAADGLFSEVVDGELEDLKSKFSTAADEGPKDIEVEDDGMDINDYDDMDNDDIEGDDDGEAAGDDKIKGGEEDEIHGNDMALDDNTAGGVAVENNGGIASED